jgi:hypothetical protein
MMIETTNDLSYQLYVIKTDLLLGGDRAQTRLVDLLTGELE